MAKDSLYARLQFVRHMYTCIFRMHNEGYTCYDPLFFHYPNIDQDKVNTEHTFIVGDALKVSPVLEKLADGVTEYESYFPNGDWVSLKDFSVLSIDEKDGGKFVNLTAPNDSANVHLMPGKIAIWQNNSDQSKTLTKEMLEDQNINLVMNRDKNMHSEGRVFLDDGETISSLENGDYLYYDFQHNQRSILKQVMTEKYDVFISGYKLASVIITNAEDLKSVDTACYFGADDVPVSVTPTYDDATKTLSMSLGASFLSFTRIHYL